MNTHINELLWQYSNLEGSMVSLERCHYLSEVCPEEKYSENEEIVVSVGMVEFRGVGCRYASRDRPALSGISLVVRPGERIGVVGRTGSGKSTMTKLLWRALDYYEGEILIDGHELSKVDLQSLISQMMVVSQETTLIAGTLRENIDLRITDTSQDDKIRSILTSLHFHHPAYLAHGLDMPIQADGTNLSAGERQLLSIARTLLHPLNLIIMDEATANIDLPTEETIQRCILDGFNGCTMIIIAHRIQTIMHCDKVIVLDKGNIIEFDSPSTLMSNPSSYFYHIVNKLKE